MTTKQMKTLRRTNPVNKKRDVSRKMNDLVGNLLCRIGWHCWKWKLRSGDTLILDASPLDHAICDRCGIRFKKISNDIVSGGALNDD